MVTNRNEQKIKWQGNNYIKYKWSKYTSEKTEADNVY